MNNKNSGTKKRGRYPIRAHKRRNLIVAYLLGHPELRSKTVVGKITKRGFVTEENVEIESRYKGKLAEKFFSNVKGNKITHFNRILQQYPDWFIEKKETGEIRHWEEKIPKELKEHMNEAIIFRRRYKKIITLDMDTVRSILKSQSKNVGALEQIDWFLEERNDNLRMPEIMMSDTHYIEIQRFYLFKKFYEFSKELYNERGNSISFKGLFNSYLLHLMFAVDSNKTTTIIVSPLLLWKAFADTFDEDYLYVCGAFSMDWIKILRKQMDRRSIDEQTEIFAKCNKYFASLIPGEGYIKTPQKISTVRVTDGSLKFLHNLNEATKWSEIFK